MRQFYINIITTFLASLLDVGGELFINFCLVFINYQELISVKLPAVLQVGPFIKFSYEISIHPVMAASSNQADKN